MATIAEVWHEEGRRKGKQEGKQKRELEIARTMLVKGMDISLIAEITGLKEEQIAENFSNGHKGNQ